MTATTFRQIALALPGALESAYMNHLDFCVRGQVFASLGAPDEGWAMIALKPEQQADYLKQRPDAFRPANGAWGVRGSTLIFLRSAKETIVRAA